MHILPLKSFTNTLVSLVLLAALVGGLSWIISTRVPPAAKPAAGFAGLLPTRPATTAAASNPAWLPEISSQAQIIAALTGLAEKDASAYQQGSFWAYQVTEDLAGSGTDYPTSVIHEQWLHFEAGKCLEMLATTREGAKSTRFTSLQIGLRDGAFGDLIALRQGLAQESKTLRTGWQCAVVANATDAGLLAARLKSGSPALQSVRAWYENTQAVPLLVVETVFSEAGSSDEAQRETRRFDMSSGRMLVASISLEGSDGRPIRASAQSKSTQFLPQLPETVLRLFQQSAAALPAYLNRPPSTPTPPTK